MERALKVVQARHVIEEVLFRYAEAVDHGDLETLAELLHACTMVLTDDTRLEGGAAIAAHYRSIIQFYDDDEKPVEYQRGRTTPRTRHLTTNVLFDFSSQLTSADVRSYFTCYQTLGRKTEIIAGGRYLDRFNFTISSWQLTERRILVDDAGDMSRHLVTRVA